MVRTEQKSLFNERCLEHCCYFRPRNGRISETVQEKTQLVIDHLGL